MLLSNDLSSPEIRVPISVTDNTPIIIPKAVSKDRVLFAKTADNDILKFSMKRENIKGSAQYLRLFYHQTVELYDERVLQFHLHGLPK